MVEAVALRLRLPLRHRGEEGAEGLFRLAHGVRVERRFLFRSLALFYVKGLHLLGREEAVCDDVQPPVAHDGHHALVGDSRALRVQIGKLR